MIQKDKKEGLTFLHESTIALDYTQVMQRQTLHYDTFSKHYVLYCSSKSAEDEDFKLVKSLKISSELAHSVFQHVLERKLTKDIHDARSNPQ